MQKDKTFSVLNNYTFLIAFFILGFSFRLWFSRLVPQPFAFDQTEYHNFAIQMLSEGLVAWQPRLYGYPLLLAFIYKLFGIGNMTAVLLVQSLMDCLSAFMIYSIAKRLFKNTAVAWIGYLLYLLNPYTSVYVILTLSEIWGLTLFCFVAYLLVLFMQKKNQVIIFALGILLGYLPQVRPAFLYYSYILAGFVILAILKGKIITRRAVTIFLFAALFFLPFTYNILGNWVYFHEFSLTTVDNLLVREFYISLYVSGRSPIHAKEPVVFPKEVQNIYNEYTPVPKTPLDRKVMANKYLYLGLKKMESDPWSFVFSKLGKLWFVWEKHFLFYYTQPENGLVDFLTYWGNNLLLFLGLFGFIIWQRAEKERKYFWFKIFVIFSVFYISLAHSFSLAEERYSLPGYPLVFLFAGYAVWNIINRVIKSLNI